MEGIWSICTLKTHFSTPDIAIRKRLKIDMKGVKS
jgi:hypothetical protein